MTTLTTGRTRTVLVVDDDEAVREIARRMLRTMGHTVLCAEDGRAALRVVESGHVEAIVLDMMMPGMNGEEFLDVLADRRPELVARVIVVTGCPPEDSEEYAIRLGVHDYLAKPYKMFVLEQKVQQVLEVGVLREGAGQAESGTAEIWGSDEPLPHTRLTPRQLEVLIGVAEGKPVKWIAHDLQISARTAREHRLAGLRRLGMNEIAEWMAYAVVHGLICPEGKSADPEG